MRLALLALLPAVLAAGPPDAGQPAPWLKLGVGARSISMGRTGAALGGGSDAFAFNYNPAALASLERIVIGAQTSVLAGDRALDHLAVARPVSVMKRSYYYGLSYTRFALNAPIEFRLHNTPDPEKTFSDSQYAVQLGVAGWVGEGEAGKLALGFNLRVLSSQLGEGSASGISGDVGAWFKALPWLNLAFKVQDLAGRMTWSTGYSESFPLLFRLGAATLHLDSRLAFTLETERSMAQDFRYRAGVEWWGVPGHLALRAGMNHGQWTCGMGIKFQAFNSQAELAYGLASDMLEPGALAHRVSLELGFEFRPPVED